MADEARKITDRRLKQIEKRITDIYTEAQDEITKSWDVYMNKVAKKLEKLQQEYDAAKASGDQELIKTIGEKLGKAKASETYQNQRYKAMLDDVTDKLSDVNQTAVSFVNGELPSIYAVNYNSAAVEANKVGLDFSLINENAVRRMVLDGGVKLPYKDLSKVKDKLWNMKKINSSVLQGIVQGESIDSISKRIFPELMSKSDLKGKSEKEISGIIKKNKEASVRNARTMVTTAENAGKYDSGVELEQLGAVWEKMWIATADDRTRETHLALDGVAIPLHEKFSNGLMFPGDPDGAPEEVYNCRCALIKRIVGVKKADGSIKKVTDWDDGGSLHKDQIKEEREERKEHKEKKK